MANMKEVADRAGVSVATVSRVINQSGYVTTALQERVKEAMSELRYHPSALARSLRRQETLTIGLILPNLDHPFFSRVALIIVQSLFKQNYRTLVCTSEEDPAQEAAYVDMLIRQRVDGVIMAPTGQSRAMHSLIDYGIAVVLFDRDLPKLKINKVLCDNRHGGYEAMKHLIALGHTNIAIIGKDDVAVSIFSRIEGARDALAEAGLTVQIHLERMESEAPPYAAGYEIGRKILSRPETRPTAIFALTDVAAVGAMRAARDEGLSVPGNLSVIGFDDIPLAGQCIPSLTTIAQPTDDMGRRAAEVLLSALTNHDQELSETVFETRLVVRESTQSIGAT